MATTGLISRAEAARRLGIAKQTLAIMFMRGDGPPCIAVGRRRLYDPRDLERYIESQRRRSTSDSGDTAANS